MKTTITLLLTLLICSLTADPVFGEDVKRDYPLPEILAYFENPWKDSTNYGSRFCNGGDLNGDGIDDLIICDSRVIRSQNQKKATGNTYIYFGSPIFDIIPDYIFLSDDTTKGGSLRVNNVGSLVPNKSNLLALEQSIYVYPNGKKTIGHVSQFVYTLDGLKQDKPVFEVSSPPSFRNSIVQDYKAKPFDFNGDGNDDLILLGWDDSRWELRMFWGGASLDTLVDWVFSDTGVTTTEVSIGYDVNGDGYDDMMLRTDWRSQYRFRLFLGGPNPSTAPVLEIKWDSVPERTLLRGYSLIPDVNGDGYDDWVIQFQHEDLNKIRSGFFLYYGSAQPDGEPDVEQKGFRYELIMLDSDVCGGDINGDGYGDIITGAWHANHYAGGIQIYFGQTEIDSEIAPDININLDRDYQREIPGVCVRIGAIGDYNGDGVQDFVVSSHQDYNPAVVIFAGNRGWKVDSQIAPVPEAFQLTMKAYPNPFNSTVKISYTLPPGNGGKLTIFTTDGRIIFHERLAPLQTETGITEWTASGLPSGVYILRIDSAGKFTTRKVVLVR